MELATGHLLGRMALVGAVCVVILASASTSAFALQGVAEMAPGHLGLVDTTSQLDPQDPSLLDVNFNVVDARGDGAGWSVTMAANASGGDNDGDGDDFASLLDSHASCLPGVQCTPPVSPVVDPEDISLDGARAKVFGALPGTGMGAQDVGLVLRLPSTVVARSVSVSLSVASGP